MNLNVFNVLIICATFQGIVFGAIVLASKKYQTKAHRFLAYIVLVISFSNLDYWLRDTGVASSWANYHFTYIPWDLLILPLFYNFLCKYLGIEKKFRKLLFIPFLIRLFTQFLSIIYTLFASSYFSFSNVFLKNLQRFDEYSSIIFTLFVVFISFKFIIDYEKQPPKSERETVVIDTSWLRNLLYLAVGPIKLLAMYGYAQ